MMEVTLFLISNPSPLWCRPQRWNLSLRLAQPFLFSSRFFSPTNLSLLGHQNDLFSCHQCLPAWGSLITWSISTEAKENHHPQGLGEKRYLQISLSASCPLSGLVDFFFLSYCLVPKGIIFRTLQLNPGYPQSRVSEVENKREWIEKENLYNYSLGSSAVLFPTTEPECKHPWWPRTREDDCSCQGALTASEPTCPHAEPQGEEGEEKKKKRTETSLLPPCC